MSALERTVGEAEAGARLDVFLSGEVEDASRSYLQRVIKNGCVTINGKIVRRVSQTVSEGDAIRANLPPPPTISLEPQDIPLAVLFEDDDVLVINKQSGLVVHPAPGHYDGTLVNAVLHHCADSFQRPGEDPIRPGIVHRLDRDTSGVMVVAKTQRAFNGLSRQAREHSFDRRYIALVRGEFKEPHGRIDAAIGRSMADRGRMAVTGVHGKEAVTRFEVLERFGAASLVRLELETGRTHQIRVHLRFAGRPMLGDQIYGVTDYASMHLAPDTIAALEALTGQALHAEHLGFEHPASGQRLAYTAPPPEDFAAALAALRKEG